MLPLRFSRAAGNRVGSPMSSGIRAEHNRLAMHWIARESLWLVASGLVAAGLLLANGGSWSVNHRLVQGAPAMTLSGEAATCALLYWRELGGSRNGPSIPELKHRFCFPIYGRVQITVCRAHRATLDATGPNRRQLETAQGEGEGTVGQTDGRRVGSIGGTTRPTDRESAGALRLRP